MRGWYRAEVNKASDHGNSEDTTGCTPSEFASLPRGATGQSSSRWIHGLCARYSFEAPQKCKAHGAICKVQF